MTIRQSADALPAELQWFAYYDIRSDLNRRPSATQWTICIGLKSRFG